jgi:regulator of protease activity HflC (stomatin/prohibitin superfamily)
MISLYFIAFVLLLGAGLFMRFGVSAPTEGMRSDEQESRKLFRAGGVGAMVFAVIIGLIGSVAIIETGKAGVVRVAGVVQQEALGEGPYYVHMWSTVTRQETRGFQLEQTGANAMEVLTGNGTKFTIELGIPLKFNPAAAALVESRIEGGDWRSEASSIARGTLRTNVSGYETFGAFNTRRSAAVDGVLYGNEVGKQIETRINTLFCDTYAICDIVAVNVGDVIIRKVNPPSAITAEAAALEAAQLSKQTEEALNEVEGIRALRRTEEGVGYGNLFSFLPDGEMLTAADAANFLRASAEKTRADADAYMQRTLAESVSDAMSKDQALPDLFINVGGGNSPTPMFPVGSAPTE